MSKFLAALVTMAVLVLGSAVISGLAIFADEVRIRREQARRNAHQEDTEDDWQKAASDVFFRG
ncbi:hypothetical protein AB0H34_11590 [Saccharopolyspora shandongensis]|uniref:hypothetical protein n=1 Tax=Saccharopolyspora shandongensis TaxID=418495 RepID=UPI0033EBB8DD